MKTTLDNVPEALETERILLKKYSFGDGENFFFLMQQNYERLKDSFPVSLAAADSVENAEQWIRKKVTGWFDHSMFSFAIIDKFSGEIIGDSILKNIDWSVPKAEIGYFISKDYEGKGLMQEVLKALIDFAFSILEFEKLYLKIARNNERSYRLAERCGFVQEGILTHEFRTKDGSLVDIYHYGLTKERFLKLKKN